MQLTIIKGTGGEHDRSLVSDRVNAILLYGPMTKVVFSARKTSRTDQHLLGLNTIRYEKEKTTKS